MRNRRGPVTARALVRGAGVLVLFAGSVFAGPAEDYADGRKAYQRGDLARSMQLLERASAAGYAPAQAMLAWIMDGAEDNRRAVALYRKAAAQGDAEGQYGLATMYLKGEGVSRDYAEAVKLLTLSAEQGHGQSASLLANAYLNGELGLEQDPARGREWLERAAAAGDPLARQKLDNLENGTQGRADAEE